MMTTWAHHQAQAAINARPKNEAKAVEQAKADAAAGPILGGNPVALTPKTPNAPATHTRPRA